MKLWYCRIELSIICCGRS